jgi:outer membrane protein
MRMLSCFLPLALWAAAIHAEVYTMTLRQALQRALQQNPDIAMARLDQIKAQQAARQQKDPFTPKIYFGSGLAYTSGFPLSIEGAAPSVVQGRAIQYLFNRQQSYVLASAREQARGAAFDVSAKQQEVAYRTASLFLDAERAGHAVDMARQQTDSLEKVLNATRSRVEEGRELPLEAERAELNLARARQTADSLEDDHETAETSLALVLGYSADDRVAPAGEERTAPLLPKSEQAAVASAWESSDDLRHLESQITAKELDVRAAKAARLPHVDLVAEYALFAAFNHYQDYFKSFQRNNGEIGVSVQLPLLPGPGVSAAAGQSSAEADRLRIELASTRNQIAADTRKAYREIHKAQEAREVARLDLEVARAQLSVNLSLLHEGRITLRQVEESRVEESRKWLAFYDAQYALERAEWDLARRTGDLLASLR